MKEDLKINFISVDSKIARNSYGEYFRVNDVVTHDGAEGIGTILAFSIDKDTVEVLVITDKGTCHLDFINHISK